MSTISLVHAREIIDSRGNPTVEVDVTLQNGVMGRAAVPSGASTGSHEALELRDGDPGRYLGQGVLKAVNNVNTTIAAAVSGKDPGDQRGLDQLMIDLDGTETKSNLGANAILGVSMAVMRAAAQDAGLPLYRYIGRLSANENMLLPQVMFNVLNGGKHANWATDVQEFFIIPTTKAIPAYRDRLRAGVEVYQTLKTILKKNHYTITVGDEGGFAPSEISSNTEPVDILLQAIEQAGYKAGTDIVLGFDAAASEFYKDGMYVLKKEGETLDSSAWVQKIKGWCEKYPIFSLEDMLAEDDWAGWKLLNQTLGKTHQLVGDDLLVTNIKRIDEAIKQDVCNSLLVKVNQIGSISESLDAIALTRKNNWTNVVSHRSGETEDTTIADFVVGTGVGQIKTGAPARSERTAKYNQLLRIEEELSSAAL
ncbi:phosphopyruvate hydratase [Candidatus Wirthbacteria bacterium CG2_30_54_11]|uniref:Enolase n=1 Tax=Candidatus Wirthbacteria bacterium CG2_30_54_11 TaxID=1817892 RepID=A0A1J5ILC8_9BACT|nr:MAG: phosphopyruvate hydratase [Candidatus Wirthbacteria bacterium CG2_30_54_11]